MSRYSSVDYKMASRFPLDQVFPEYIVESLVAEAKSLRTNTAGIATAVINVGAVCTGVTFVRGPGGMITRPQNFDVTFAETGSGKSAALDYVEFLVTGISRVLSSVLPFMNLNADEMESLGSGPFSKEEAIYVAGLRVDKSRIPAIIKAQTVQAITTSILGKVSPQSPSKKHKSRDSESYNSETEQHKNIIVLCDEANAFEANIMSQKNSVAQIETLYVQLNNL